MGGEMELKQAVYTSLLTQIQFGLYKYGESLPGMEEICRQTHISVDTVKAAYHRLRQEGYISLSQRSGAKVAVRYSPEEKNRLIQDFFAQRKTALIDLSRSIWPLFGWAGWLSLKHTPPDVIGQLAHMDIQSPNAMYQYLEQKFDALGNGLLSRLIRQIYLFFQGPFYSVKENEEELQRGMYWLEEVTSKSRSGEWDALASVLKTAQDELAQSVAQFYEKRITGAQTKEETVFGWSVYKKSSQLRYSLAIEILTGISRGVYPEGSYLPPAEKLSREKGVSVSTIRRTVSLLNSIGAVKSSRTLGARVLSPLQSTRNCDFTHPDIQVRLLEVAESLQIYALSSRAVSKITLDSVDKGSLLQWKQRLSGLQNSRRYEMTTYYSLELIARFAPYRTIRVIYSELLKLLFWGNPLRGLRGDTEKMNQYFEPAFRTMVRALEEQDFASFSAVLEELLLYELRIMEEQLRQLGIMESDAILIPGESEVWECGR